MRKIRIILITMILLSLLTSILGCSNIKSNSNEMQKTKSVLSEENIKKQKEEEQKRLEEEKKAEEQRRIEEERKLQEQKKLEEQKALEEQKKLEEQKALEEKKKLEEEKAKEVEKVDSSIVEADAVINSTLSLDEKITKYLGNNLSKVGLVYYDIGSGNKIAFNENNLFLAASTVKVQMNMVAYDWVKQGKLSLDEKLKYSEKYYEAGTGILQSQNKTEPIPVQTLLDYSIIYSDNIATNMMLSRLGGSKNVRKLVNEMVGTNIDITKNYVTAEEEFRILKKLYDNREDKNYAHLIDVMKNTTFHDRIDKYVPKEICAHKIGNYGGYTNDVGIIFAEKPYILVVYTNGLSGGTEKIAQISRIIYDDRLKRGAQ